VGRQGAIGNVDKNGRAIRKVGSSDSTSPRPSRNKNVILPDRHRQHRTQRDPTSAPTLARHPRRPERLREEESAGDHGYMRDVAHVRSGLQVQPKMRHVRRPALGAAGGLEDAHRLDARHSASAEGRHAADHAILPPELEVQKACEQSVLVARHADRDVLREAVIAAAITGL